MKLLIQDAKILAVDVRDAGDNWESPDLVVPKHVAAGAYVVEADLPEDFSVLAYSWDGALVATVVTPPPPPVPQQVTMRQACLALENAGLLDEVEALVATLPRPYQIEWERASVVQRDNALVEVVRQQQGMTVEQIDDLFRQAETL
jgi:hypothetical protein